MSPVRFIGLQGFIRPRLKSSFELIIKRTKGTDAKKFQIECGNYAGLANGCAVVQLGGTAVMGTVVAKGQPCDLNIPLRVTYTQKAAAIGRIPTNFLRRDLGRSDQEILLSRAIDRSIRPLFEPGKAIETQIYCSPMAMDGVNFPDVVAINAASAALLCSDIPWLGPVAAVRVALIDNEVVLNPTKAELAGSVINLIVSCVKNNKIVMIEGSINNKTLEDIGICFKTALKYCKQTLLDMENKVKNFKKAKRVLEPFNIPENVKEIIKIQSKTRLTDILCNTTYDKLSRDEAILKVHNDCELAVKKNFPNTDPNVIGAAFFLYFKDLYKNLVLKNGVRCDGRKTNALREISGAVHIYDALHGSSVFKRGQTQVFCTVALDSPNSALRLDNISSIISGLKEKNFFFDYQFPSFATGDVGERNVINRRERGHGALAENALKASIPGSFPFTIRLTSEVLESNGSSSMASVCGGTMALYDAGIELQFPVAGVAMGLFTYSQNFSNILILTDLMGMEDYLGDMDFKIAGTKTGFTALQLDMKIPGLPLDVVMQALSQGKKAIGKILVSMEKVISKPCAKPKSQLPAVQEVQIPLANRFKVFGQGRAWLKRLELEVGVEITVSEDGKLSIFAINQSAMDEALNKLKVLESTPKAEDLEFGAVYNVTVVEVLENGCFVKLNENLANVFIPLSQLDSRKVFHPKALNIEVGSEFMVKFFGRDPSTGAVRLSRRVLLEESDR